MEKLSSALHWFLDSPRSIKRSITIIFDALAVWLSISLAIIVNNQSLVAWSFQEVGITLLTLVTSIVVFIKLGFYRAILRYIGITAVSVLLLGVTISAVMYGALVWLFQDTLHFGQSIFYWCFLTLTVGGSRLIFRAYIRNLGSDIVNVAIYGAGAAGRQLASALRHGDQYRPVLFIDDDYSIQHSEIDGLKVHLPDALGELAVKHNISHVLLALPSVSHSVRNSILKKLEPYPLKVKTIAGLEDIVNGKVNIEELKELDIEDLLGRDSVNPDQDLLEKCIANKVVMVTGAGGSIGSELCRQIIRLQPTAILLYELSEFGLYKIEAELRSYVKKNGLKIKVYPLIGSVENKLLLKHCMSSFGVSTVYHAAAYKHVPIVEHNIVQGIRNNVFGTFHAAEAADEAGVEKFVLISTDKAVRPTNVMGASKRVAELALQALNERGSKTVFTMVRFGNVLGSSGSVVPLFREQIRSGGPVTVTHPDIIRYFMTIPEAAQLVIQAGAMGRGGDVFVLDMGEPVKIATLAERMIHLMGRTMKSKDHPEGDIEIKFSGLRPGEKLYEELLVGENVEGTEHPRIMTAKEEFLSWPEMQSALGHLEALCNDLDCHQIVQCLLELPTGYNPQHDICDLLSHQRQFNADSREKVVKFKTLS